MIFSSHRKKLEPRRRYGGRAFRDKIKDAANYKRVFNPGHGFSLSFMPNGGRTVRVVIGIAILLFLVSAYYMIVSSDISVTTVTINGNHQVSTQQIEDVLAHDGNSRLFLIKKNNFFLMSRGRINDLLTSSIPTIKEIIKYKRIWPNKVAIEIIEHTPGFVIESNGEYFLVDDEGVVVSPIDDPQKLMVAKDQLVEDFARGETLPNQKLAPFILSMNKLWGSKMNVPITAIKFPGKAGGEAEFVTSTGWSVLFDTGRSVTVQLSELAVILSKEIKPSEQANLAYIDLRLSKWAYYCFKATPCHQQERPAEAGTTTDVQE